MNTIIYLVRRGVYIHWYRARCHEKCEIKNEENLKMYSTEVLPGLVEELWTSEFDWAVLSFYTV